MERLGPVEPMLDNLRISGRGPEVPREAHREGGGARRQGVPGREEGGVDLPPLEGLQEGDDAQAQENAEEDAQKRHILLPG